MKKNSAKPAKRLLALVEEVKGELGIRAKIRVCCLYEYGTPALLFPNTVLMPVAALAVMDEEQVKLALRHELMHYKRGDHAMGWLLSLLNAVYWFHPFVWLAFRTMRADMETACDSAVTSSLSREERKDYASMILELFAQPAHEKVTVCMAALSTKKVAEQRIRGIFMKRRSRPLAKTAATVLSLALAIGCFTTACQPAGARQGSEALITEPQSGGDGLENGLNLSTTSAAQAANTPEPVLWNAELANEKGNVRAVARAAIIEPANAAFQTYRIDPCADFSQDFVDAVHSELLDNCALVDANKPQTISELEEEYAHWQAYQTELDERGTDALTTIADGHTLGEELAQQKIDVQALLDGISERLKTAKASAPDVPIEPNVFAKDTYGGYGFSSVPQVGSYGRREFHVVNGTDGEQRRDYESSLWLRLGGQYAGSVAYDASSDDWIEWYGTGEGQTPPFPELPKKLAMTAEEAKAFALDAFERIGFPLPLTVAKNAVQGAFGRESFDERPENNYAHLLLLQPLVNGAPVFYEVSRLATDTYDSGIFYRDEEITVAVNDTGLHELSIMGYFTLGETLDASPELISIETAKDKALSYLLEESLFWDEQGEEGTYTALIDRMELGYARTIDPDDPAGQILIPVWNVYCTFATPDPGTGEPVEHPMDFPAVTVNALDGSRL